MKNMEPFRCHIFVCTQQKPEGATSCPANRSLQMLQTLEHEISAQDLDSEAQLTTCGCLGLCDDGPIMIVYPEGTWYRHVQPEDVGEIVASHLRAGRPVARLVWNDAPAMKKQSVEHRDRFRAMLKARNQAGTLPDDLYEMARSYMSSRALLSALELDIFTALGAGARADQVAKNVHADPRATEMLLNALVSLRLLEKKDGSFLNTPASARFFTEGSPDNARPNLLHTAHLWRRWSTLTDAVRSGTAGSADGRPANWVESFIAAMDSNAKERAGAVLQAVGASDMHRMLDLGGGSGAYSIAFAKSNPQLKSEILDLAEVVPLTAQYIQKAGLADRIITRAGDMLSDPLGENYDLILVSAICHMFSPEENQNLFRRAYHALAPTGRLVVQDFILEPSKTAPRAAALFSLNMLVGTRAGSSYSEPEYEAWLGQAGFRGVRRVRLPGPSGLMIAFRS
jgi:(2Fe-2S) ferredoxin/predicted O-methyltransferase YrrM